jgi:Uma2 family endonuclease
VKQARFDSPDPALIDQRVYMHDVSWQAYEALLAWRGESSSPRMTYLDGELELMAPSRNHEAQKARFARLLEAWSEEMDIGLEGAGSWTLIQEDVGRGLEPDECYLLLDSKIDPLKAAAPDIAIEVVWTRGGLDKLEVYRKLGVREVWIWCDGKLRFHLLRGERYVSARRSEVLPKLDPIFLATFMQEGTQPEAVKALRAAVRKPKKPRAKK